MTTFPIPGIEAAQPFITSGIVKVTPLFANTPGPLPLTGTFDSSGGNLLIFVSGSMSTEQQPTLLHITVYINNVPAGAIAVWSNVNSHMSLVPGLLVVTDKRIVAPGSHVLLFDGDYGSSDQNDYYDAVVIELAS